MSLILLPLLASGFAAAPAALTITEEGSIPPPAFIWGLAYSPDGRLLATSHLNGTVIVWDASAKRRIKLFRAHDEKGCNSVAFSPDGKMLATSGRGEGGQIALWDTETWKEVERFPGFGNGLTFFPGGEELFGRDGDHLTAWRIPGGRARSLWKGPEKKKKAASEFIGEYRDEINGAALSADGQTVAVARLDIKDGDTLFTLDVPSAEKLSVFVKEDQIYTLGLSGAWLASVRHDGKLEVRDLKSGKVRWSDSRADGHWSRLAFTPDEARVVAYADKEIAFFDAATGKHAASLKLPATIVDFLISPTGKQMTVSGGSDLVFYKLEGVGGGRLAPAGEPSISAAPVKAAPGSSPVSVDVPPATKAPADPDAYAVVVGIENYRQKGVPPVEFASRDAETIKSYLTASMGFDAGNVILLRNEEATKTDLEKYLGPWLKNRATPKSRLFIYFAGHGSPDPETGEAFLVPYEGDPQYADVTAFPLRNLWSALAKLPSRETTVVLDSCFSGQGQRSVIAKGTRPLVAVRKDAYLGAGKAAVIAAAAGSQVSTHYPEARHGLLTYFLLRGLGGEADSDKDGTITTAELFGYAKPQVERQARLQNVEQSPTLTGPGSAVWLRR